MPNDIFMSIETTDGESLTDGASSKDSVGAFFKANHEDEIFVLGYHHEVNTPTDRRSGQVTGPRKHGHLCVTKLIDKSSPLLFTHLVQGTALNCTIDFYRIPDTGEAEPENYYSIELEQAKITGVETISPNILDPRYDDYMAYEQVSLRYMKISGEHVIGSTEFIDDFSGEE